MYMSQINLFVELYKYFRSQGWVDRLNEIVKKKIYERSWSPNRLKVFRHSLKFWLK